MVCVGFVPRYTSAKTNPNALQALHPVDDRVLTRLDHRAIAAKHAPGFEKTTMPVPNPPKLVWNETDHSA